MKRRRKYNEVKVANISRVTVTFLEVGVWKEGSRFVTPPEFKPTSPWQPLGYDSAHAPHCRHHHVSRSAISPIMFMRAKSELIKRFREHFAPESAATILQNTDGHVSHRTRPQPYQLGSVQHFTKKVKARLLCFKSPPRCPVVTKGRFTKSAHESELLGRARCQPAEQSSTKRTLMANF